MKLIKYSSIVIIISCIAWTGGWFALEKKVESRIADAKKEIEAEGIEFDSFSYTISGFPFSYNIEFDSLSLKGNGSFFHSLNKELAKAQNAILSDIKILDSHLDAQVKDLKITSPFWSPFKQTLSTPQLNISLQFKNIYPVELQIDQVKATFSNKEFIAFSYASSVAKSDEVTITFSPYKIKRIKSSPQTFQTSPFDLTLSFPLGYNLQFSVGQGTWSHDPQKLDRAIAYNEVKFILTDIIHKTPLLKFGLSALKGSDKITEKKGEMVYIGNNVFEGIEYGYLDKKGSYQEYHVEKVEIDLNVSSLEWPKFDWYTLQNKWKNIALAHLRNGQKNVPELKELIANLESAQFKVEFDTKVIYNGRENFASLQGTIKDLFPEGKISFYVAKDFFRYVETFLSEEKLSTAKDSLGLTIELKNRTLSIEDLTDKQLPPIEWENLPILTEDFCTGALNMEKEEYLQATAIAESD